MHVVKIILEYMQVKIVHLCLYKQRTAMYCINDCQAKTAWNCKMGHYKINAITEYDSQEQGLISPSILGYYDDQYIIIKTTGKNKN